MKIFIFLLVALAIFALVGTFMSHVDEPKFEVTAKEDNLELRYYEPMVVAEVEVTGNRREAISKGFKILADYIFGNNVSKKKLDMTAPVSAERSEKLAMTAPVMEEENQGQWKVKFVMPEGYTLETLPKPQSSEVKLIAVPSRRFAVIRFSGLAGQDSLNEQTEALQKYILTKNLKVIGKPIYAFYNPPWTLPFMRRNEVMIEIAE